MEIWRDIEGYEKLYQVSSEGRIKSLNYNKTKKEKLLTLSPNDRGYLRVALVKGKTVRHKKVHRLVAEAFIPNHQGKTQIDHKDGNKQNNNICNLKWATPKENCNNEVTLKNLSNAVTGKLNKTIYQYTLEGVLVKKYNSMLSAAEELGINQGCISNCCNGRRKTYKGYRWSFEPL